MPFSLHDSKVTIYADGTSLAYAFNSLEDMAKSMNADLENLRKWLHGDKLTLNAAKTISMIIGTNRKLPGSSSGELIQAHFKISGEAIEQKTYVKYLEVILDNQMTWKDHINLILLKVSKAIAIIQYAQKALPLNLLKNTILRACRPSFQILLLCLGLMWGHYAQTLDKLQNRAIRIITNSVYDVSVKPQLRQLQLPSISDMIK